MAQAVAVARAVAVVRAVAAAQAVALLPLLIGCWRDLEPGHAVAGL